MSAQHSYAGMIIMNAHTAVARLIADISAPMAGSTALTVGAGGSCGVGAFNDKPEAPLSTYFIPRSQINHKTTERMSSIGIV